MTRVTVGLGVLAVAAMTAACGQKGPLYLPPRNGTVVTRPGMTPTPPPDSTTGGSSSSQVTPSDTVPLQGTPSGEASPGAGLRQESGPATQAAGAGAGSNPATRPDKSPPDPTTPTPESQTPIQPQTRN